MAIVNSSTTPSASAPSTSSADAPNPSLSNRSSTRDGATAASIASPLNAFANFLATTRNVKDRLDVVEELMPLWTPKSDLMVYATLLGVALAGWVIVGAAIFALLPILDDFLPAQYQLKWTSYTAIYTFVVKRLPECYMAAFRWTCDHFDAVAIWILRQSLIVYKLGLMASAAALLLWTTYIMVTVHAYGALRALWSISLHEWSTCHLRTRAQVFAHIPTSVYYIIDNLLWLGPLIHIVNRHTGILSNRFVQLALAVHFTCAALDLGPIDVIQKLNSFDLSVRLGYSAQEQQMREMRQLIAELKDEVERERKRK